MRGGGADATGVLKFSEKKVLKLGQHSRFFSRAVENREFFHVCGARSIFKGRRCTEKGGQFWKI